MHLKIRQFVLIREFGWRRIPLWKYYNEEKVSCPFVDYTNTKSHDLLTGSFNPTFSIKNFLFTKYLIIFLEDISTCNKVQKKGGKISVTRRVNVKTYCISHYITIFHVTETVPLECVLFWKQYCMEETKQTNLIHSKKEVRNMKNEIYLKYTWGNMYDM